MSDLIGRSELIKEIEKYKFGAISNDAEREYVKDTILNFIICQPTAYDIDKVVEDVRCRCYEMGLDESQTEIIVNEIVKQGDVSAKTDDCCEWKIDGDRAINPHTFSGYKIKQCDGLYALGTCPHCRKKIKVIDK